MPSTPEKIDFFISYNKTDKAWAEWIAWELEEADYTTIFQAWDFRPGRLPGLSPPDGPGLLRPAGLIY